MKYSDIEYQAKKWYVKKHVGVWIFGAVTGK